MSKRRTFKSKKFGFQTIRLTNHLKVQNLDATVNILDVSGFREITVPATLAGVLSFSRASCPTNSLNSLLYLRRTLEAMER